MENKLTNFIEELTSDANGAKNLWSNLIGNYDGDDKNSKPLLDFYNSLPEKYKDKKIFRPIVIKYFMAFKINQENYLLYQEYENNFSDQTKIQIKEKNQNWDFPDEEIKFKSTYQIVKLLSKLYYKQRDIIVFFKKYEENIFEIAKKDSQFIYKLEQQNFLIPLFIKDAKYMKEFIKNINVDFNFFLLNNEIWKKLLVKETIFNEIIDDFMKIEKEEIKKNNHNFFVLEHNDKYNILDMFVQICDFSNLENVEKFYQYFQEEFYSFFEKIIEKKILLKDIFLPITSSNSMNNYEKNQIIKKVNQNEKKYVSIIYNIYLNEKIKDNSIIKKGIKI